MASKNHWRSNTFANGDWWGQLKNTLTKNTLSFLRANPKAKATCQHGSWWSLRHHGADIHFIHTNDVTQTETSYFSCNWSDSNTKSVLKKQEYIEQIQSDVETIDMIDEIDVKPYVLTTYQVNVYVLRRYSPTKTIGNPQKFGSW